MPQLTVELVDSGELAGGLRDRIESFLRQELRERKAAAERATEVSRAQYRFTRTGRPPAPLRYGRLTTGGQLARQLAWRTDDDGVEFDRSKLDRRAPYWIIQEVGTGERAIIRRGGQPNPRGRPGRGAQHVVSIKSQRGRQLPSYLAWGDAARQYSPSGRRDQLFLRRDLSGVPAFDPKRRVYISREIRGGRFVQWGGREGYRKYHNSMGQVWRNTLVKAYRPS